MPEELYYAPLAERPVVRLDDIVTLFSARGRGTSIQEHSAGMCWLVFEEFESQLVVSTTPDEKKEIGLITLELSNQDGEALLAEIEEVMAALGFSNDPEAQYR